MLVQLARSPPGAVRPETWAVPNVNGTFGAPPDAPGAGVGGTSGLAIVEIYDITPVGPPSITVSASIAARAAATGAGSSAFLPGHTTTSPPSPRGR